MDERAGLRIFNERFRRYLDDHPKAVTMPMAPHYLPLWLLEDAAKFPSPWLTYLETESGAMQARWLAERDANPNAVVPSEDARVIVRPLLDLARAAPVGGLEVQIAQYWITHEEGSAEKWVVLRFLIAAASRDAVFYRAVKAIAKHLLQSGEPLGTDLRLWLVSVLDGKKPAGMSGHPKKTLRDRYICLAIHVLKRLGLTVMTSEGEARERSACGIVADELVFSYEAIGTVWLKHQRSLGQASSPA